MALVLLRFAVLVRLLPVRSGEIVVQLVVHGRRNFESRRRLLRVIASVGIRDTRPRNA